MLKNLFTLFALCVSLSACFFQNQQNELADIQVEIKRNYSGNENSATLSLENSDAIVREFATALKTAFNIKVIATGPEEPTFNSTGNSSNANETFSAICPENGETGYLHFDGEAKPYFRLSYEFNYQAYCYDNWIFNGKYSMQGIAFSDLKFHFTDYHYETTDQSYNVSGEDHKIHKEKDETGSTSIEGGNKFNLLITDNINNVAYLFENYDYKGFSLDHIDETENRGTVEVEGRIYHSELGYLDIKTSTQFLRSGANNNYLSGEMLLLFDNGASIKILALNSSQYRIEIDLNNDSDPEYTETNNWDDMTFSEPSYATFMFPRR